MKNVPRSFIALGMVVAALTCIGYALPGWASSLCVDWQNLEQLAKDTSKSVKEATVLDDRMERAIELAAVRRRVVGELISGRITLLQAAIAFRDLTRIVADSGDGRSYVSYDKLLQGKSQGERLCRQVILLASHELAQYPPSFAESTLGHLDDELRRLLVEDGTVLLPKD